MILSGMVGGLVFCGCFFGDWDMDRIINGFFFAANTTAVAFWIVFALSLSVQARRAELDDESPLRSVRRR